MHLFQSLGSLDVIVALFDHCLLRPGFDGVMAAANFFVQESVRIVIKIPTRVRNVISFRILDIDSRVIDSPPNPSNLCV
jgi:hypothetical protein